MNIHGCLLADNPVRGAAAGRYAGTIPYLGESRFVKTQVHGAEVQCTLRIGRGRVERQAARQRFCHPGPHCLHRMHQLQTQGSLVSGCNVSQPSCCIHQLHCADRLVMNRL